MNKILYRYAFMGGKVIFHEGKMSADELREVKMHYGSLLSVLVWNK